MEKIDVDILIFGVNRASLVGAIYCARENLKTIIIDSFDSSSSKEITEVKSLDFISLTIDDNIERLKEKAIEAGVEIVKYKEINKMILTNDTKVIEADVKRYVTKAVILTNGNKQDKFDIENEYRFRNKGIYYHNIGSVNMYKNQVVAILGDGDSSIEEALYLAKSAKKVVIIRRDTDIENNDNFLKEIKKNDKISIIKGYEIIDVYGSDTLEGIYLNDIETNKHKKLKANILIGSFKKKENIYDKFSYLEHRNDGYIKIDDRMQTNIKGVFAAGAAIGKIIDEIPKDINEATLAALEAIRYLK